MIFFFFKGITDLSISTYVLPNFDPHYQLFFMFIALYEKLRAFCWPYRFYLPHTIQVASEIDQVIGRERAPRVEDRKNLPYTEATLLEVLRFRPILPAGVPHISATDVKVRNYVIPKDSEILINILAMHLDPTLWDDPEVFNPKRFLSDDEKTVIKKEAFIVFGAGNLFVLVYLEF